MKKLGMEQESDKELIVETAETLWKNVKKTRKDFFRNFKALNTSKYILK